MIGKVDGQRAALHIGDIQKYSNLELNSFGSAQNVLIRLKETKSIYATVEKKENVDSSCHFMRQDKSSAKS